jgi:hypothetical protein
VRGDIGRWRIDPSRRALVLQDGAEMLLQYLYRLSRKHGSCNLLAGVVVQQNTLVAKPEKRVVTVEAPKPIYAPE